mmetsp:Transcript_23334/g.36016  ORF Transcript_23334/g.36016 Transcript_23334/m.36016 type:complete len:220 (+) Transcript_23334:1242-1901(+)
MAMVISKNSKFPVVFLICDFVSLSSWSGIMPHSYLASPQLSFRGCWSYFCCLKNLWKYFVWMKVMVMLTWHFSLTQATTFVWSQVDDSCCWTHWKMMIRSFWLANLHGNWRGEMDQYFCWGKMFFSQLPHSVARTIGFLFEHSCSVCVLRLFTSSTSTPKRLDLKESKYCRLLSSDFIQVNFLVPFKSFGDEMTIDLRVLVVTKSNEGSLAVLSGCWQQ